MSDAWRQGIYPLAWHLQDLDFSMFLGRGIGHDSYLFSAIYLFSLLSVCYFRFVFIYLFTFITFTPSHRRRPEDACKSLLLVCDLLWMLSRRL